MQAVPALIAGSKLESMQFKAEAERDAALQALRSEAYEADQASAASCRKKRRREDESAVVGTCTNGVSSPGTVLGASVGVVIPPPQYCTMWRGCPLLFSPAYLIAPRMPTGQTTRLSLFVLFLARTHPERLTRVQAFILSKSCLWCKAGVAIQHFE